MIDLMDGFSLQRDVVIITDMQMVFSVMSDEMRGPLEKHYQDNKEVFDMAKGSLSKHHARPGGLVDHTCQFVTYFADEYRRGKALGIEYDFTISDGGVIAYLHDGEKMLKYSTPEMRKVFEEKYKSTQSLVIQGIIQGYNVPLKDMHYNALKYVHGEGADHNPHARVMNKLAGMCNRADSASALDGHDRNARFEVVD